MYTYPSDLSDKEVKRRRRNQAVVEMLFATGARVSEISNLKADCVDLNSGLIRIMGKGAKERYIQIGEPEVLNLLKKYYADNEKEIKACGYFFINQRNQRFTEQSIRGMIKKYARQAGIERNITPHMFRLTFATRCFEKNMDPVFVQSIMGHANYSTTLSYTHILDKIKQREVEKAGNFLEG